MHDYLINKNFHSAIEGFYSGHGLSITIEKSVVTIKDNVDYEPLYSGDSEGAKEFLEIHLDKSDRD